MELGRINLGLEIESGGEEETRVDQGSKACQASESGFSQSENISSDEDELNQACSFVGSGIEKCWTYLNDFGTKRKRLVRQIVYVLLALLYNSYFVASVYYSIQHGIPMDWCNGVGLLIILTVVSYLGLFYFQIVKRLWGKTIYQAAIKPFGILFDRYWRYR